MNANRTISVEDGLKPDELVREFSTRFTRIVENEFPEDPYVADRIERTANLVENITGSNQLELATRMHELYIRAAVGHEEPWAKYARDTIASGLAGETIVPRDEVLYATAIESCSVGILKSSEAWKDKTLKQLREVESGTGLPSVDLSLDQELRRAFNTETRSDIEQIASEIQAVVEGKDVEITETAKRFRVGLDLDTLVNALDKYDIDAFYVHAAAVVEQIRSFTSEKGVISEKWQTVQTALSFTAPALELLGDSKTATWVRDEALQALYQDDSTLSAEAKKYHDRAEGLIEDGFADHIEEIANSALSDFEIRLEKRTKSVGSTIENMHLTNGDTDQLKQPNDMLGFRVILVQKRNSTNTSVMEDDWEDAASVLSSAFEQAGITQVGDSKVYLGQNTKPSGYKAVHENFIIGEDDDERLNIELQIVSEHAHNENQTKASPVLQKARYGLTELSAVLRRRDAAVMAKRKRISAGGDDVDDKSPEEHRYTADDKKRLSKLKNTIEDIRNRAQHFKQRMVKPRSISRVASVKEFAQSDNLILGPVSEMDVLSQKLGELEVTVPTEKITVGQFTAIAEQLMPEVINNPQFQTALGIARELHTEALRKTGDDTNVLEGHILPTVIALMYRLAKDDTFGTHLNRVNVLCAAMLHDFKEDGAKLLHNDQSKLDDLNSRYDELITTEGFEEVGELVWILTKPTKEEAIEELGNGKIPIVVLNPDSDIVKDKVATMAIDKVIDSGNRFAQFIKFYDRAQNIRSDIAAIKRMIKNGFTEKDEETLARIIQYQEKSEYFFRRLDLEYVSNEATWVVEKLESSLELLEAILQKYEKPSA